VLNTINFISLLLQKKARVGKKRMQTGNNGRKQEIRKEKT
jgi:hypothetical protein